MQRTQQHQAIVEIFAPGAPMRSFHEWAISSDGFNWQALPTTIKANTTVEGLQAERVSIATG